jgi:hypothetical protein
MLHLVALFTETRNQITGRVTLRERDDRTALQDGALKMKPSRWDTLFHEVIPDASAYEWDSYAMERIPYCRYFE